MNLNIHPLHEPKPLNADLRNTINNILEQVYNHLWRFQSTEQLEELDGALYYCKEAVETARASQDNPNQMKLF